MLWKACIAIALAVSVASCGGTREPAERPTTGSGSKAEQAEDEGETAEAAGDLEGGATKDGAAVPTECHKGGDPCLPDPRFVRKLCNSRYPSMALYLFANSQWTRGYMTRKTEAWNASGGASAGGFLEFDEEVLLLFERKADLGGMQVSGAGGGFDALRWDGSCVTLSSEEVTRQRPPSPKITPIEWRYLDDNVQEALRKDERVNSAYLERRKECKGAVSGEVSLKCVKADTRLTNAIVEFVRGGGTLPVPSTLPN